MGPLSVINQPLSQWFAYTADTRHPVPAIQLCYVFKEMTKAQLRSTKEPPGKRRARMFLKTYREFIFFYHYR